MFSRIFFICVWLGLGFYSIKFKATTSNSEILGLICVAIAIKMVHNMTTELDLDVMDAKLNCIEEDIIDIKYHLESMSEDTQNKD